ncbi:hypothetical protein [uncultured Aquimarina sp.]|uniref:hypothetical protein n=1 Tax=uncultured Aquimarina sp. TaxID=575652 RepID=UPI00263A39BE|nr:hypothetical protein [uncultured Aquimarina sp.]
MITHKKTFYFSRLILLLVLLVIYSCQKDQPELNNPESTSTIIDSQGFLKRLNSNEDLVRTHKGLVEFIKNDDYLHKRLYQNEEFIVSFLRNSNFNEKGIMSFNYKIVHEYYPEDADYILSEISKGFGFDYDEVAKDHEGYTCTKKGNCYAAANNICTSNCSVSPDLYVEQDIYKYLNDFYKYIQVYIDPDFNKKGFDSVSIPRRISSEQFFETYNFEKMFEGDEHREQVQEEILKEKIVVMSSELVINDEIIHLASLLFTKGSELQKIYNDTAGILVDSRFNGDDDIDCYYGGYGSACSSCMWVKAKECWTHCEFCDFPFNPNELENLVNPKVWNEDLILLGQLQLGSILEGQPVLPLLK